MTNLVLLDYPLDIDRSLIEAEHARNFAKPYTNKHFPNVEELQTGVDQWLISKYNSSYIERIAADFEIECKPRFYFQAPGFNLPEHVDTDTECSINFVLSDDPAPITFADGQVLYKQALLNTKVPHAVFNGSEERILLKLSITNYTFEQMAQRIKFRLGS